MTGRESSPASADRRLSPASGDRGSSPAADGRRLAASSDDKKLSVAPDNKRLPAAPDGGGSPARVVVDADVLAADLLCGGAARDAVETLWRHSWTTVVASDRLIADARRVIAACAGEELASDWREQFEAWREPVGQPDGDHPALASAYHGGAMHVVALDERLTTADAGLGLTGRFPVSIRTPDAFTAVFDPERLYPEVVGGEYPGPDRQSRSSR